MEIFPLVKPWVELWPIFHQGHDVVDPCLERPWLSIWPDPVGPWRCCWCPLLICFWRRWCWPNSILGLVDPCLCSWPHSSQGCDVLKSLLVEPWLDLCPAPVIPWVSNWVHGWAFGIQYFGGLIVGVVESLVSSLGDSFRRLSYCAGWEHWAFLP